MEKPETDLEADLEIELSEMEIYEGFLDGEIMIEKQEDPVYIDELFWDNDMEYCFADIDGDGSEELHIRDSMIYYMITVKDKKLRLFLKAGGAMRRLLWEGSVEFYFWILNMGMSVLTLLI